MTYNYSYHLLLAVFIQTNVSSPKGAIVRLGSYDNANPRTDLDRMEKDGKISPQLIAKLRRRQAAHENCYENLGIFAAAVVAGNQVGLGAKYMNTMAGAYLALRCLYVWLYINTTTKQASYFRSLTWWERTGNAEVAVCFLTTLWKVGTKLNGGIGLLG